MLGWIIARMRNAIFHRRMRSFCKKGHHLWLSEIYGEEGYCMADICVVCKELRIDVEPPPVKCKLIG